MTGPPAFSIGQTVLMKRLPELLGKIVAVEIDPELVDSPYYSVTWVTGDNVGGLGANIPETELSLWEEPPTDDPEALDRWLETGTAAPSITCAMCKMTSYNPADVSAGWCARCNDYSATDLPAILHPF